MFLIRWIKQAGPVVWAGLCFLVYAAIAVPLGHYLQTTAMTASGLDTLNDGMFFFFGGVLSWLLLTRKHHLLSCTSGYALELLSFVFGIGSYALATFGQASTNDDLNQAIWSVVLGIVGIALNWYWYTKVKQLGFRWNLLANYVGAGVLVPAGFIAYIWHCPAANKWAAIIALIVTTLWCIKPAIQLVRAVTHRSENHDASLYPR